MTNIRIFFSKHGRLKYISHLDLSRLFSRVLKKTGLPVWYTEGFNPHMHLTFALPLSLGFESDYEIMDIKLTEEIGKDEIKNRLNSSLPEGIEVFKVAEPVFKYSEIAKAAYTVDIISKNLSPERLYEKLSEFLGQESITVKKKTKKGVIKDVDIKPDIEILELTPTPEGVKFSLMLPAGGKTVNPSLVCGGFLEYAGEDSIYPPKITRTGIFKNDGDLFV